MLTFFILHQFEYKVDREISHFNYNSKYYDKCKSALKLMSLLTVHNLSPLEVAQKCQHCQLCVLRENSIPRACSHQAKVIAKAKEDQTKSKKKIKE